MNQFESIDDVAQILGDGGDFSSDTEFKTVEELVDALVTLGNTDKVFASHDDHLGLKSGLSEQLLQSPLDDIDKPEFQSGIEEILDQANIIISLSNKELSEDDIEDIREDKMSRGEDPDD